MRVGSLFSGVGGMDLGLERAGFEVVWMCEKDPVAREVLAHHWPTVPISEDVNDIGSSNLSPVNLIAGGFPCQDLSVAGLRAGLAGKRSGLVWQFLRIVDELRPEWLLIENVAGLLSSHGGRDMGAILGAMGELGYGYAYRVLNAEYFGVPQRRNRVFIVGRSGGRCPGEVLFERESLPWNPPPSREAREEVAGTLGGGAGQRGWAPITHALSSEGADASEDGTGRGTPLVLCQNGSDVQSLANVTSAITAGIERQTSGPCVFDWQSGGDVRHNVSAAATSALQRSQTPAVSGKTGVRRLMPVECERLQGWPDGWTAMGDDGREIADSPRYRMIGNGVVSHVAEWIGRRIIAASEQ